MNMVMIKDKLPSMLDLARDRTESARLQLAGMLADIFLTPDIDLSLRDEELVNELIDQLMINSTPAVRMCLIEKFVDVARMPGRIAGLLARDTIETARTVLISNPHLSDDDLIDVITIQGQNHALAIASRAQINEAVADALITTGDVRVMQVVVENLGAHLTSRGIEALANAAHHASLLREPLLRRPEMDATTAMKLYWWVEQDLRRYTLKRFGINAGQIEKALATTISSFLEDNVHERSNDTVMEQVADWMDSHQALTVQMLPQVLRMGHFRLFNILLARLSKLNLSLVDMITQETGGRGLAAICRAIDVDKPSFVSLFLLSRGGRLGDQVVHPRELSHALATFDRMSSAIARDLLYTWKVNPDYLAKHVEEAVMDARMAVY